MVALKKLQLVLSMWIRAIHTKCFCVLACCFSVVFLYKINWILLKWKKLILQFNVLVVFLQKRLLVKPYLLVIYRVTATHLSAPKDRLNYTSILFHCFLHILHLSNDCGKRGLIFIQVVCVLKDKIIFTLVTMCHLVQVEIWKQIQCLSQHPSYSEHILCDQF